MNQELLHHYRQSRQAFGEPFSRIATDAYWAARRTIHFRADLKKSVASDKKRSAAAKRGWKNRRANQ